MKAALYARVSDERQAEKDLSIPAQLKALRKYARERDWEVVAEYVEAAETATRTANRPKFKEMVASARSRPKPFDAILVWKLNRFARNREDSIIHKSLLRKQGVQVISINQPVDDTAAGKLYEGMIEVIDEFYSSNLAEDVLRGMTENAERGFRNGGPTPFGYQRVMVTVGSIKKSKLEPKEAEASIVKRMFQMALSGEGVKNIAKALNRDGLRTKSGKPWGKTTINTILRNEVHSGATVWRGKKGQVTRTLDTHPALISREDFDKVQHLLTERMPNVRHPRTVTSRYLLSPLLHCVRCGSPMIGCAAKSGQYLYYQCSNTLHHGDESCAGSWLPKDKIEGFVVDKLQERVLTDENLTDLVRMVNEEVQVLSGRRHERLEEIEKQLESVNQNLLKYFLAFEKGTMSDEDAAPRIRDLRAEQTTLQQARDQAMMDLEDTRPKELNTKQILQYAKDLRLLLGKGSLMEQKAFLRSFVRRIDFQPEEITINYTIPMPVEKGQSVEKEVLSIGQYGGPSWARTKDLSLIRTAL